MFVSHYLLLSFVFSWYGHHRELHVLTHSFPTRRSSDLAQKPQLITADLISRNLDLKDLGGFVGGDRGTAKASPKPPPADRVLPQEPFRSEEHTSELPSLMRISYAVFCLKKKKEKLTHNSRHRRQHR